MNRQVIFAPFRPTYPDGVYPQPRGDFNPYPYGARRPDTGLTPEMARELGFIDGHVQGREATTDEILFGLPPVVGGIPLPGGIPPGMPLGGPRGGTGRGLLDDRNMGLGGQGLRMPGRGRDSGAGGFGGGGGGRRGGSDNSAFGYGGFNFT